MTEIIVRSRLGGKTTELIRRSAETGACIVCTDTRRAGQVMRKARELGLSIPMPLTAGEWQERAYYPKGAPGLLFDDLDRILQLLSPVPVLAVSWTGRGRKTLTPQPEVPTPGSCQFFSFPAARESAAFGITTGSDPNFVLGCEAPQGDGPLFFLLPVPGGAVRVPVCAKHGERLAYLYGPEGGGSDVPSPTPASAPPASWKTQSPRQETLVRRDPFTFPREECPVETASLVLNLKDGRKVEYTVSAPDAARLLCDYPTGTFLREDDINYGGLPITPPRVIEPPSPLQFTVTFGFRLMRRDEFLRVTETPAEKAES